MATILFIDNTAHHLYGQRHNIHAMHNEGHQILLLVPDDGVYFQKLQQLGFKCIGAIKSWQGQNPLMELKLFLTVKKLILALQPDLVCSFTIKPNLYTALAVRKTQIKQIANITGLGYAFMSSRWKAKLFTLLYRTAFKQINYIFFQNNDDFSLLRRLNIISKLHKSDVLPGSGVNLSEYSYSGLTKRAELRFLFCGRLLADKGIFELIEAYRQVKQQYPQSQLIFIGDYYPSNPSAISAASMQEWINQGLISYLGMVDNAKDIIAQVDCVILPSYREGMPRVLLEASSMGKPIITVDSIGCRDAIEDGVTGFMAKVKDVDSLVRAMIKFIQLPFAQKNAMGINGRCKMEREFDQKIVVAKYLAVVKQFLQQQQQ